MTPNKAPGFSITDHKGFQMTFANGYTVSVQFGPGSYCERKRTDYSAPRNTDSWTSGDAEIAAWDSTGKWYSNAAWGDDVKGHNSPDEVAAFIEEIRALPRVEAEAINGN